MKTRQSMAMLFVILSIFFLFACNPVSENINDPLWNSLHNSKPFQSSFFHSANYRFPHGSCDEVQCHGTALTGGNSGAPSCFSCHDNQWSIFGISHTAKISKYYHKFNVDDYPSDRNNNVNWFVDCQSCHGASLSGTQGGPSANFAYRYSCKVCHSRFSGLIPPPGHNVNKSEDGNSGWHHFNYKSANPDSGNNADCAGSACHGSPSGRGSVPASGNFGRSKACGECH